MKLKKAKLYSRKSLSLFLAAVMLIMTCSVAFGLQAFAAQTTYLWQTSINEDTGEYYNSPFEELADLLEDNTALLTAFKTNTATSGVQWTQVTYDSTDETPAAISTITLSNYDDYVTFLEIMDLVYLCADWCVFVTYSSGSESGTHNYYYSTAYVSGSSSSTRYARGENMNSIYETMVARLTDTTLSFFDDSSFYSTYGIANLLHVIFDDWSENAQIASKSYNSTSLSYSSLSIGSDDLVTTVNVITTDVSGWLAANGAANYEDMELQTTYKTYMQGSRISWTYLYSTKYAAQYLFMADGDIVGNVTTDGGTAEATITTINAYKTALADAYAVYPTYDDVLAYYRSDSEGCLDILADLTTLRSAAILAISDADADTEEEAAYLSTMIGEANSNCYLYFLAMEDIRIYDKLGSDLNDYVEENNDYGVFDPLAYDYDELVAAFVEFETTIYTPLLGAGDTAYASYCKEYGLDENYYTNFSDNIAAYKAADTKDSLDSICDELDGLDVSTLDASVQSTYYTQLNTYLATAESYSEQVQKAIFTEDLDEYYELEAQFECELNAAVAYFTTMGTANYDKYDTEDLLAIFVSGGDFDKYYAQLEALKADITSTTDEDYATALLATTYAYADGLKAAIYDYLGARFEGQVAFAMTYASTLTGDYTIDAALYMNLKASVGAIEGDIYTTLSSEADFNTYIETDYQKDYLWLLSDIIPEYEAVGETLGFNVYEQTDVVYSDRDYYKYADVLKDEDTSYEVTDDTLTEIITTLDSLLTDEDVLATLGELLGMDMSEGLAVTVQSLLEDMLFSDSIINMVVQFLYPTIQGAFSSVSLPSTVTYAFDSLDEALAQDYSWNGVTHGLASYPSAVGDLLGSDYAAAAAALQSADMDWESSAIYNSTTGLLTLEWGVDEAIAAIDAGTYEGSETKLEIFVNALGAALEGSYPLLGALLSNRTWKLYDSDFGTMTVMSVYLDLLSTATPGYVDVFGAIYDMLGYYDYSTVDEIAALTSATDLLTYIFDDIYGLIDFIFESPVENILNAIPNIIYALEFDMIPDVLSLLNITISYEAGNKTITTYNEEGTITVDLGPDGGMIDLEKDFGLDTSGGVDGILDLIGISLDNLNTGILGTCGVLTKITSNRTQTIYDTDAITTAGGTGNAIHIDTDTEGVLYYLLTFIVDGLKDGSLYSVIESILELVGTDMDISEIEDIISSLNFSNFEIKSGDVVAAIAELFTPTKYAEGDYVVVEALTSDFEEYVDEVTGETVGEFDDLYSDYWTIEQAEYIVDDLLNYVLSFLEVLDIDLEETASGLITDLLSGVYTNSTLESIFDLVDGFIGDYLTDETIAMIIDLVVDLELVDDIDVEAIVANLSSYEYDAIEDGNRDEFIAVIVDYILPLQPVLEFFLTGSSITLLSDDEFDGYGIEVYGYNGYESAIIPLFEALGCVSDDIVTYDQLDALTGEDYIYAVLEPIMGLLDRVDSEEEDLFEVLLEIAPNILYFVQCGGLNSVLSNLLIPVYAILDTIRPIYDIQFSVNFDVLDLVDGLLGDLGLDDYINLSVSDLFDALFAVLESEERISITGATYNYVAMDEEDYANVVTVLLRYISSSVTILDNTYVQQAIELIASLSVLVDEEEYPELYAFLTGLGTVEAEDQILFLIYYVIYGTEAGIEGFNDLVEGLLGEGTAATVIALAASLATMIATFDSEALSETFSDITDSINESLTNLGTNISGMFTGLSDVTLGGGDFTFSTSSFTDAFASAQETFTSISDKIQESGENFSDNVSDAVTTSTNAFVAFFQELFAKIKAFFDNLFSF